MITTAKNNIEQFENNLETQPGFLTQKIKNDYLSDKRGTLNNFYCFGNCNLMLMGQNLSVCGQQLHSPHEEEHRCRNRVYWTCQGTLST